MSSKEDSAFCFYSDFNGSMATAATSTVGLANQPPAPVSKLPMVVNSTSSSSTVVTTIVPPNSTTNVSANKKHNLGYRIRRFLFPQLRSSTSSAATLVRHKSTKDMENNDSQSFPKHNGLHSTFSSDSNDQRSSSKRKHTRNKAQQTDTLPEFPIIAATNKPSLSVSSNGYFECPICLLEQEVSYFPELSTCPHRACITCLRQYLRIEIFESRINITCPECSEMLHPNDIKAILQNDNTLIEKYELFMVRRTLIVDPDARWCPAPDCDYCVIAYGCASCPMLKCERPGCDTLFCYHCKQEWHSNQTCDQARAQRGFGRPQSRPGVSFGIRTTDSSTQASTSVEQQLQPDDVKPCPCCRVLIIKMDDGSCNHMTCSVCRTEFCWLCMQKISDLHYLSPSGCTFWGKKPWSRKKKILWQLGMLAGAPVGIALIAGIAVPAIIIGMPVWVGRKLYARFERNRLSRHKSNLLVTTGVLTSIFVSPILAAVAVGIGVPILLAYVYGVVPISLCRSGGCSVNTSNGVRIELDDDDISTNVAPDGVSVDTALSGRGFANPSIGEASLGMSTSLSIGSSTHLDRIIPDIQPDRESSSIAACAGSISSSMLNNGSTNNQSHGHKLETHVDINSNKRYSFSSQNADATSMSLSLGDRSINTIEDSSMKVHAGSIRDAVSQSSHRYSVSPVDVHVNIGNESTEKNRPTETPVQSIGNFIPNKFESRSLEYLTSNYCNICHKSHKPCCPNFQHPGGGGQQQNNSIKIKIPQSIDTKLVKKDSSKRQSNLDTGRKSSNNSRQMPKRSSSQVVYSANQKKIDCKVIADDIGKSELSHSYSFSIGTA